jgi:signal transduction histidine kinase
MSIDYLLSLLIFYGAMSFLYFHIKSLFPEENKGAVIPAIYAVAFVVIVYLYFTASLLLLQSLTVIILLLMTLILIQLIRSRLHNREGASFSLLGMFLFYLSLGNTLLYYAVSEDMGLFSSSLANYLVPPEVFILSLLFYHSLQQLLIVQKNEASLKKALDYADRLAILDRCKEEFLLNTSREIEILLHRIKFHADTISSAKKQEGSQTNTVQRESLNRVISECKRVDEYVANMFLYLYAKDKNSIPLLQASVQEMAAIISIEQASPVVVEVVKKEPKDTEYTEIKRIQEELDIIEKSRRDLYSSISHDLRTPLTSIKGYIEAILDGVVDEPAQQQEYLKRVQVRVEGLIKLVEELSTIMHLESKGSALTCYPMSAEELLHRIYERFKAEVSSSGLSFHTIISPELREDNPAVLVDYHKIERVYGNLISNALRYTPVGGMITIGAEIAGDDVAFRVADSGCGLNKEDVPYLFERFFMGTKNRASITGNSGLGLSIAKKIVESHKGRIWVETEQSKGATFYFKIPRFYEKNR